MTIPSCDTCYFNVDRERQLTSPNRSEIGAPLCGAGHGPINLPDAHELRSNIGVEKAKMCGTYAEQKSSEAGTDKINAPAIIMLPDPVSVGETTQSAPNLVSSCLACKYYIAPAEMVAHGLWNVGSCAKRGIMVHPTETKVLAKDCGVKSAGVRDPLAIERMRLSPEYTLGTNIGTLTTDPVEAIKEELSTVVIEPTEYLSDRRVTDDEAERGIRAWRAIPDPDSDRTVLLPIYNIDFFSPEEQAGIPRTGDDEHPEQYVDHMGLTYKAAVLWMHLDETPALWGVAGTGKTEFYRYMAWLMCLPFHRISVTASTEVEDLAGKMHYEPSRGTYFEYGRIPKAWGKPGIICLDEPNVGPPDVWQFIRPLTDNSKQMVLDMNNGERISRHEDAYLGLAMNPAWDVRNVGTGMLADADGSRLMHIFVDLPDSKTERRIIRERCKLDDWDIPEETLDAIMRIAVDIRRLCDEDTLPITWGIRPQIKVARALKWFSYPQAYRLATADYLEPEQAEALLDAVKANAPVTPRSSR